MYRVYRGILQPHKRTLLAQRVSVISHHPNFSKQNSSDLSNITSHWKKYRLRRESSTASMISEQSSGVSSCGSSTCDLPQRSAHRRVTFSLNPALTIQEHTNESESDDVFKDCFVMTNAESVNEMETDI